MPWTQADVDALKAAIASGRGARTISFADQTITFQDISEMLRLLAMMEREVGASAARPTTRYAVTTKGV